MLRFSKRFSLVGAAGPLAPALALVLLAACSSGGPGSSCHTDVDCASGLFCGAGGSCLSAGSNICATSAQCAAGQVCSVGVCVASAQLTNATGNGSGATGTNASGATSGSTASSSTSSSGGFGTYCQPCTQDSQCGANNSCQYDPSNTYTACAINCGQGQACPSTSECEETFNNLGLGNTPLQMCMPADCPTAAATAAASTTTTSTTTSSTASSGATTSGRLTSATTTTTGTTTTSSTTTGTTTTTTTTTTSSSSTSGCAAITDSTEANSFYSTNCNYCHGHSWAYTDGCNNSEISGYIDSGYMPTDHTLTQCEISAIEGYINSGCPK